MSRNRRGNWERKDKSCETHYESAWVIGQQVVGVAQWHKQCKSL
jgi:hypothetical protein